MAAYAMLCHAVYFVAQDFHCFFDCMSITPAHSRDPRVPGGSAAGCALATLADCQAQLRALSQQEAAME